MYIWSRCKKNIKNFSLKTFVFFGVFFGVFVVVVVVVVFGVTIYHYENTPIQI